MLGTYYLNNESKELENSRLFKRTVHLNAGILFIYHFGVNFIKKLYAFETPWLPQIGQLCSHSPASTSPSYLNVHTNVHAQTFDCCANLNGTINSTTCKVNLHVNVICWFTLQDSGLWQVNVMIQRLDGLPLTSGKCVNATNADDPNYGNFSAILQTRRRYVLMLPSVCLEKDVSYVVKVTYSRDESNKDGVDSILTDSVSWNLSLGPCRAGWRLFRMPWPSFTTSYFAINLRVLKIFYHKRLLMMLYVAMPQDDWIQTREPGRRLNRRRLEVL